MVEVQMGTPLAEALSQAIQSKFNELGWASGGADEALADYIVLMLGNGKTQQEIITELSSDFLGIPSDDPNLGDFVRWVFEQVNIIGASLNGGSNASAPTNDSATGGAQEDTAMDGNFDASMADGSNELNAPTGPKSMRGGGNFRGGREKRMMGQINRALDRTPDASLHRTRGQNGVGKAPPSGPRMGTGRQPRGPNNRAANIAAGISAHGMPGMPMAGPGMNGMNGMNRMHQNQGWGMPGQPTPADMALLLEQNQMLMQALAQQAQGGMMNNGAAPYGGRPLSERVQRPYNNARGRGGAHFQQNGHHQNKQHSNGQAPPQGADAGKTNEGGEGRDVDMSEGPKHDVPVEQVMCKFNLQCRNADCKFAHQSPAAPPGTTVDVSDVCSFGAACKNRKCVGRHPSPAKKISHMSETDCKYYPHCTNPHCPFKHPEMPPCRNGGECKVPNCKFTHVKTQCKFHPCTNRFCPFSHEEGQRGSFPDKVWTAEGGKEHVSERKFVDDATPEKLVLPEGQDKDMDGTTNGASEPQDVVV